jgi:RNA polymerase sigma-70 factor (ECF subfamily)
MLMSKSDSELIAGFLAGDQSAFEALVKRHQSSIRQFLRRLTAGDHALADDIAQDVFVRMFTSLSSFRGQSTLSTWLHTVAYRMFLRHVASSDRLAFVDDEDFPDTASSVPSIVSDIMVEQMMKHLSLNERLMVTLSYSAGMSHSEIADATGAPLGTIKSHVNRAKRKLAKLLNMENPNA